MDNEVMWLNVTNAVLGVCVLICVLVLAAGIARDVMARIRQRLIVYDPHSLASPELGLTMADGGEPETKRSEERK